MLGRLFVLPGGSLYAANSHDNGGMERSLNPGAASYPYFEKVNTGLANLAALNGIWGSGNQLWSIDSRNIKLMTYVDSLIAPVVPGKPAAGASGIDTRNATLDWGGLAGAVTYEWQIDNNGSFSAVPNSFYGETASTFVRLPRLEPGATYYWRVRVKEPTLSPWSPVRSFHTLLGSAGALPELYTPKAGANDVAISPVFQWAAISGADRYELMIAANNAFRGPIVARLGNNALTTNAWQCDTNLSYSTTYFWKVRGISSNSYSPWSGVGTFTTLPPPEPAPNLEDLRVELLSPTPGAQGIGVRPVFQWKSLAGCDKYELLVSTKVSFPDVVIAKFGTSALESTIWQSEIALGYGTTYFWKVRGVSGINASAWSDVNSFSTIAPPSVPNPEVVIELQYPQPRAELVSIKPMFQWKPVAGADGYELLVASSQAFSDIVISRTGTNALSSAVWQTEINLEHNTTYYWKVRAIIGGNRRSWSDASAFTTVGPPAQKIAVVELENPKAGAEGISVTPIFQWKSVTGAERYELLLSASPAFANPVIARTGIEALAATAWRSDVNLENDATYYWKVRAVTGDNLSIWSDMSAFRTAPKPPAAGPQAVTLPLNRVELISPNGGAVITTNRPLFEWQTVAGADKYELLVSQDAAFAGPVIIRTGDYAVKALSWQSQTELANDMIYYWKVKAVAADRSGGWSLPGVFITEADPVPVVLANPSSLPSWAVYAGIALIGTIGLLLAVVSILTVRRTR